MQIDEIFQIWDRFEKSKATEFTFECEGKKLTLKKDGAAAGTQAPVAPVFVSGSPMQPAAQQTAAAAEGTAEPKAAEKETDGTAVRAPFVGTFYRASAPGEEPFVKLGQKVSKGDVLGIIEAMKLMNEITAPCDGVITEIMIEDETMVEYDQILMSIGE